MVNIRHRLKAKELYEKAGNAEFIVNDLRIPITAGEIMYFNHIGFLDKIATVRKPNKNYVFKWKTTSKFRKWYEGV